MANVQETLNGFVEVLLAAIEAGEKTGTWVRPWVSQSPQRFDGKLSYSGSNVMFLMMYCWMAARAKTEPCPYKIPRLVAQWESMKTLPEFTPYYGTLNQWSEVGARVKLGAKELPLMLGSNGKKEQDDGTMKYYTYFKPFGVFNSSQVEGWEAPTVNVTEADTNAASKFDAMLAKHSPRVIEDTKAAFNPVTDLLMMPPSTAFPDRNHYYGTFLHELVHWTGHSSRLDRKFSREQELYAFEELVAELGSTMLSAEYGFAVSDQQTLAYLSGWGTALKADKTAGRRALSMAMAAVKYLNS
jgi:antirestriction protein ArdC